MNVITSGNLRLSIYIFVYSNALPPVDLNYKINDFKCIIMKSNDLCYQSYPIDICFGFEINYTSIGIFTKYAKPIVILVSQIIIQWI